MDKRVALIGGMGLGAGIMFLLDPNLGRRRRHIIRDKARSLAHEAEDHIGKKSRHFRNHAHGLVAETRARLQEDVVDDFTLIERVRAALGRVARYPRAIDVLAMEGRVTITGPVLASDRAGILAAVRAVRGVKDVTDRLEGHETAENVPALQGAVVSSPREEGPEPAFS
jgi:hypothetical protein